MNQRINPKLGIPCLYSGPQATRKPRTDWAYVGEIILNAVLGLLYTVFFVAACFAVGAGVMQ